MIAHSAWSSAVINPIIYAFGSSQYRIAYKNLFITMGLWRESSTAKIAKCQASGSTTGHANSVTALKITSEA